jgi:Holliday junction resolvase RusA-like endonuclease
MANGVAYKPKAVRDWQEAAAWRLKLAGGQIWTGPVAVSLALHPKMTIDGHPYKKRTDLDNSIKAVLDACQGVVFANDKQVQRIQAEIADPIIGGGVTVMIWEIEDAKNV